jgi:hypothetical protein
MKKTQTEVSTGSQTQYREDYSRLGLRMLIAWLSVYLTEASIGKILVRWIIPDGEYSNVHGQLKEDRRRATWKQYGLYAVQIPNKDQEGY